MLQLPAVTQVPNSAAASAQQQGILPTWTQGRRLSLSSSFIQTNKAKVKTYTWHKEYILMMYTKFYSENLCKILRPKPPVRAWSTNENIELGRNIFSEWIIKVGVKLFRLLLIIVRLTSWCFTFDLSFSFSFLANFFPTQSLTQLFVLICFSSFASWILVFLVLSVFSLIFILAALSSKCSRK